jgi:GTP-binding protein Era
MTFRCGYVALIGQPNAGKSTLLNQILGSKLAITSAKPQTTRHRIAGLHNDETCQIILLDSPGIHEAWNELNKSMVQRAMQVIGEADAICWILDASVHAKRAEGGHLIWDEQDQLIARALAAKNKPMLVALNKIDVVPKPLLLPVIGGLSDLTGCDNIRPISALNGDGVADLMRQLGEFLPEHPPLFPQDEWAQVTERFLASEIIREKIFHLTEQEIPYASSVQIETFDESGRTKKNIIRIFARISVERNSQKGIVIGKRGEMLKRIGTMARKDMEKVFGCRVYLELFVKVEPDWTKSKKGLKKVGYDG